MKHSSLKSLLNFFLASTFLLSAQTFLLISHRQTALLWGLSQIEILAISIFLIFTSYFNLYLAFYQHSSMQEKIISLFSLLSLSGLVFLYLRAALFVEGILFWGMGIAQTLIVWRKGGKNKDFLLYTVLGINFFIGLAMLVSKEFLGASLYQKVSFPNLVCGAFFLGSALFRLLAEWKPTLFSQKISSRLLVLPWLGWALLFARIPEVSIWIPAVMISMALLSSGLLPFEKFRLRDNRILGYSVFPLLALLHLFLLVLFFHLTFNNLPTETRQNDLLFAFLFLLSIVIIYSVMKLHYVLYALTDTSLRKGDGQIKKSAVTKFIALLFEPSDESLPLSEWQAKKIRRLSIQLIKEHENAKRFDMLSSLRRQLDASFDEPVSAQLVVNTVNKYFNAGIVAVLLYDIEAHELSALAVSGKHKAYIPPGYRQNVDVGILGRSARLQKIQIVNDTTCDQDYINPISEKNLSEVSIPLIYHGHLKGVLLVGIEEKDAFSAPDVRVLEAVAEELLKTWEHSSHNRRMTNLIQSSISLSTSLNTQQAVDEITGIARETLQARFVFVTLLDQEGTFTRTSSSGYAPKLEQCLKQDIASNFLLQAALEATSPSRIRDMRKYKNFPSIPLDHNMLRGLIMIPIRLHGVSIGAILGFGKQGGIFFSEKDESLANLLATQAAAAIESAWLIHELRSTTITTTLLYHLSFGILQTDTIRDAARLIAQTAHRLAKASVAGIVLFSLDRKIQTALEVTSAGVQMGKTVPLEFIEQTLHTGESITLSTGDASSHIYLPIQTSLRKYGVLWVEFQESERQAASQAQNLQTLANQAAMALERVMLLLDLRQKAAELKDAFSTLEDTYDQTLSALMSALDARDRETEGHSLRVGHIACQIGKELNLSQRELISLRRGALLHDIGKIGIRDNILHKPGPLTNAEWEIMRQHPLIGAKIVQGIPFLEETMPIIRSHHERWNGSGYPLGLQGEDIPLPARIFAVSDVFDALTSKRPYRKTSTNEEAFAYIRQNAAVLFDPKMVNILEFLIMNDRICPIVEA